jgi:hypothetical protein
LPNRKQKQLPKLGKIIAVVRRKQQQQRPLKQLNALRRRDLDRSRSAGSVKHGIGRDALLRRILDERRPVESARRFLLDRKQKQRLKPRKTNIVVKSRSSGKQRNGRRSASLNFRLEKGHKPPRLGSKSWFPPLLLFPPVWLCRT